MPGVPISALGDVQILSCVVCWLGIGHVWSAEPAWQVGLAHVKITPPWPVVMAGYAGRDKPFEKVENDLYAKALALKDSQGQLAVLVTSDLLGFWAAVVLTVALLSVGFRALETEAVAAS